MTLPASARGGRSDAGEARRRDRHVLTVFGSVALDVAIGLVLLYFLLAVLVSTLNEFVAAIADSRAKNLEIALRNLLDGNDHAGAALVTSFYNHPLICSLHTRRFFLAGPAGTGKKPSYIPARMFRTALEDTIFPADPMVGPRTIRGLKQSIGTLPPSPLRESLLALVNEGEADLEKTRAAIEHWFDDAMDRVSGWYKRQVGVILLVIALGAAFALNADTLAIATTLARNPEARAFAVATAEQLAKQTPLPTKAPAADETPAPPSLSKVQEALQGVAESQLPLGWHEGDGAAIDPTKGHWDALLLKIVGCALTGVAVSFGAPFWFDLLNKLVSVRTAVKPKKSEEDDAGSAG